MYPGVVIGVFPVSKILRAAGSPDHHRFRGLRHDVFTGAHDGRIVKKHEKIIADPGSMRTVNNAGGHMFLHPDAADGKRRRVNGRKWKEMFESMHNKKIQLKHNSVHCLFQRRDVTCHCIQ